MPAEFTFLVGAMHSDLEAGCRAECPGAVPLTDSSRLGRHVLDEGRLLCLAAASLVQLLLLGLSSS